MVVGLRSMSVMGCDLWLGGVCDGCVCWLGAVLARAGYCVRVLVLVLKL